MNSGEYWLAFGDIHDDLSRLTDIPELAGAAGVIVTGDITFAGGTREAMRVLEPIAARVPRLMAQIGNMDRGEVTDELERRGWNLHARALALFPGIAAVGVGTSPPTPFGTPSEHSEAQLTAWMAQGLKEAATLFDAPPVLVLVSHTPPHATNCDRLTSGAPAGSKAVRECIEQQQPAVCLCGHIHEARSEDRIGATWVINSGTLSAGGYVVLGMTDASGRAEVTAELKTLS